MKTRDRKPNGDVSSLPLLSAVPPTRNRKGPFAQIPGRQSQVHGRALGGTMSQDIADGLKGSSILQEMKGVRVAQAMWALIGNAETAFANQCLKSFRYGSGLQHPDGIAHSKEDTPICGSCRHPFYMLHHSGADPTTGRNLSKRR